MVPGGITTIREGWNGLIFIPLVLEKIHLLVPNQGGQKTASLMPPGGPVERAP
jgi:hypothetical protein